MKRSIEDVELKDRIAGIHLDFPCYGYRRIRMSLARGGVIVNHKRLRRIMREYGLFSRLPRAFTKTTDSRHAMPRFPNLLGELDKPTAVNQAWAGDITFIRIQGGWAYLAVILDLYSRKVIGWSISKTIDRQLTLAALRHALELRRPPPGCVHHSDQGLQYACAEYVALLESWKMRPSMSRRGNPYDNAATESFMKTLKYEAVYLEDYQTFDDVLASVPRFVEEVYNRKRLHSSLGYQSPDEFESRQTFESTRAAGGSFQPLAV